MTEIKGQYTKQTVRFGVRLLCFLVIAFCVLGYALYVLTPKHDYGICAMNNLYAQPDDSIDVLAVGTSQLYAGINTNVLWARYGIAAYDLCSAEQPFWVSYYMIREALKTQHPKVILLDVKPSCYIGNYTRHGRIILSTFGIRGLENRFGAIRACVKTSEEAQEYIFGITAVHSNYESITLEDFKYPLDNSGRGNTWKGYIEMDQITSMQRPYYTEDVEAKKINAREEEYIRKIIELVQGTDTELVFICMPFADYPTDQPYFISMAEIAEEYGVQFWDFNTQAHRNIVDENYDFADYQHLNIRGSINFSLRLGNELRKAFSVEDHRKDDKYISYENCTRKWYEEYSDYGTYP